MSHIEIILPFGLPPAKLGGKLLRTLQVPALAALVSRTQKTSRQLDFDALARTLPHEAWLAHQFGLTENLESGNSPPFAGAAMHLQGVAQEKGYWFILHPAHIQLGHDHMVMADRRILSLPDVESRALFDAAKPLFEEAGKSLLYGDAMTWFVRADDWKTMVTATPDMACGRNLANWMPEGNGEQEWRKLLNEVQMVWHRHPVNTAREARAAMKVNSLWIWGCSSGSMPNFPAIISFTKAYRFSGRMEAYGQFFPENELESTAEEIMAHPPDHGLVFLDNLIAPALAGDWGKWLSIYQGLEDEWFAPLLEEIRQGHVSRVSLNLSNDTSLKTFISDRASLRKFWVRKSMTPLLQ
jgi:hypothetical protein